MVILLDDDQISPMWVAGRDGGALEAAYAHNDDGHEQEGMWRQSLDQKNQRHVPTEYRSWERWSDHFDQESETRILAFDIILTADVRNSDCTNCGHSAWDLVDTPNLKAIQCRSCGHTPTECGSARFASSRFSTYINCSRMSAQYGYQESEGSSAEGEAFDPVPLLEDDEESTPSEADDITEKDFASAGSPRHAGDRRSGILSVRQSMVQPAPRPRWFEAEDRITFQFKLTPRNGAAASSPAAAIPKANEDGSSAPAGVDEAAAQPSGRGVGVRELGSDHTAWQRLLTSALFLIKEDNMPLRPGESKVLNLGLREGRQSGGKHLAMRHQSSQEHEESAQGETGAAKRIKWRVVVRQAQKQERGGLLPR